MSRWLRNIGLPLLFLLLAGVADGYAGGGSLFLRNYLPEAYQGHHRNFDIVADKEGRVFVANFEGLLCYDQSEWRLLRAPGTYRFTCLLRDSRGRIWFGGYNLFGYVNAAPNGQLRLTYLFSKSSPGFLGEVVGLKEVDGTICLETTQGDSRLEDGALEGFVVRQRKEKAVERMGTLRVNRKMALPDGGWLLATAGSGLLRLNAHGDVAVALTEKNGLCDNNVNAFFADSLGYVWGATDRGVFLTDIYSAFTHYGPSEGLLGEVQSLCVASDALYAGTLRGLFREGPAGFERVSAVDGACWQLTARKGGGVVAATASGLYVVWGGVVEQLTQSHALSVWADGRGGRYLMGELDGIYALEQGHRRQVGAVEKVTCLLNEGDSAMWARNIYGQVFRCSGIGRPWKLQHVGGEESEGMDAGYNHALFSLRDSIFVFSPSGLFRWDASVSQLRHVEGAERCAHPLPHFLYPEGDGRIWSTDRTGKQLSVCSSHEDIERLNAALRPVCGYVVQCMSTSGPWVWLGGSFGVIRWNSAYREPDFERSPKIRLCSVRLNGDSVVWGGFGAGEELSGHPPFSALTFDDGVSHVSIGYAADGLSTLGDISYRYRLNAEDDWCDWTTATVATFANPRPGKYRFEVMARDRYGRLAAPATLHLTIRYPVFLRWYSWVAYGVVLFLLVFFLTRWRMQRLLREKVRLENIVESRTSQIRQQKDEIEEKSKHLETALQDLGKAQYELVRREKMATMGTLTQGLVDRILNPMNYVNNFSHLSRGLVEDMGHNLTEERDRMTPEGYDDSMDILDMLRLNLTKIEEHGLNTTRILKAMEEMLKEREGHRVATDIVALCRKNFEMLRAYYGQDMDELQIRLEPPPREPSLFAEVDAEQLSRTVMSILSNSVYALRSKWRKGNFQPLIRLRASVEGDMARVSIYDNGIGIEPAILDKIFDPFFTTKTTAEAVGVGMYMSREVVRNHGGDITVTSVKDEYTEFVMLLPLRQPRRDNGATETDS